MWSYGPIAARPLLQSLDIFPQLRRPRVWTISRSFAACLCGESVIHRWRATPRIAATRRRATILSQLLRDDGSYGPGECLGTSDSTNISVLRTRERMVTLEFRLRLQTQDSRLKTLHGTRGTTIERILATQ